MVELAIVAAACMVVTDIVSVIMVQAEATNRGWLAGWMDTFGYLFSITSTSISVAAVNGDSLTKHIVVLGAVSLANLFGTKLGTEIGRRLTGPNETSLGLLIQRVAALEEKVDSR